MYIVYSDHITNKIICYHHIISNINNFLNITKNLREKPDEEEEEEVRLEPLGTLVHDQFQFFSNHIFGGNQGILLTWIDSEL